MGWLWDSWEEFVDYVQPQVFDSPGVFREAQIGSRFGTELKMFEAVEKIEGALRSLSKLNIKVQKSQNVAEDDSTFNEAYNYVEDVINYGERLLLYNKRLAKSGRAYGFLHQHVLLQIFA